MSNMAAQLYYGVAVALPPPYFTDAVLDYKLTDGSIN